MAKANYVKLGGAGARGKVRASARYYGHRPNAEGQKQWRLAFTETYGGLSKEEVKELVDRAEGSHAYRMVLSPGREMDEGELSSWTREVMASGWERGWFGEVGGFREGRDHPTDGDRGREEGAAFGHDDAQLREVEGRWGAWRSGDDYDMPDYAAQMGVSHDEMSWYVNSWEPHAGLDMMRYASEQRAERDERVRAEVGDGDGREQIGRYGAHEWGGAGGVPEDGAGDGGPERWMAWAHTDHTHNPHVHVITFTDRRLERGDFTAVREEGDAWAERIVESRRELEQDPLRAERANLEELAQVAQARAREHEPEVGHGY